MQSATVLIVDDVAETRSSIGRLLELSGGFTVVGEAADGQQAIDKVQELRPDCVLLDVNMPVLDGISAAETLSDAFPDVAIVMMSVQGEQEYLHKAMAAGARDYLIKPFSPEELAQTLKRAVQATHRRRQEGEAEVPTQMVLVLGPKGGVGRSTIAANVALGLAAMGDSTCLIDLNAQFSDLAMTLDIVPAQTLASLANTDTVRSEDVLASLEAHNSGLHVLFAPARPEESEAVTSSLVDGVLQAVQGVYRWVVIDGPAQVGDTVLPVLDRHPECLPVVTPELAAVRNAGQLLQLMRELEYDTDKTKVILNRWEARTSVTPEVIERNLQMSIAARIPFDPSVMQSAATRGIPVVEGEPRSSSAKALLELVDELTGKVDATPKHKVFGLVRRETRWAMG